MRRVLRALFGRRHRFATGGRIPKSSVNSDSVPIFLSGENAWVRETGKAGLCPRCVHTAHDDIGECKACYCRSATL